MDFWGWIILIVIIGGIIGIIIESVDESDFEWSDIAYVLWVPVKYILMLLMLPIAIIYEIATEKK